MRGHSRAPRAGCDRGLLPAGPRTPASPLGSCFLPTRCFHGLAIESKIALPFLPALVLVPLPEQAARASTGTCAGAGAAAPCRSSVRDVQGEGRAGDAAQDAEDASRVLATPSVAVLFLA